MKQLLIILFLISNYQCNSQIKNKTCNDLNKQKNMKILNINIYNDWKIDTKYSITKNDKFLKKMDERVKILDFNDKIKIERLNVNNPITNFYFYFKSNNSLQLKGQTFYTIEYDIWKYYDETGKLIKEIDFNKPYKFSISDLINKFNKEHNLDLENPKTVFSLKRYVEKEYLNIPIYEVGINKDSYSNVVEYYLVDGNNGKTLYSIEIAEGEIKSALNEYIKQIKKKEEEDNKYYRTYKGKDYTKKEWEEFQDEWHKNYQEKKDSKGFWDDIFKRPGKK